MFRKNYTFLKTLSYKELCKTLHKSVLVPLHINQPRSRLDFRLLPGPVFDRGMSAGSFSRTASGNRA